MFTPRGYTAVPQDVASQDEDEVVENNNLSRSFEHRNNSGSGARNMDSISSPRTSRECEEGETKERRVKRNVRFESRSMDADKPEPMSNARRLCFVISLMICTLTIFVFAFTVPCKGPSCNVANMITTVTSNLEKFHRNWSVDFSGYSTGIAFHLSSTKTREIVVSYDGKTLREKDLTRKHGHEKFGEKWNGKFAVQNKWNTKKSGLISLNEDNGKLQWSYNASDVMKLIECRTDDNGFETCLIQSSHGKLQLINPKRNQIVWSTRILIGSLLPSIIIGISDCDGDDGRDILLSYDRFNTSCIPPTNKTVCTHPGIVQLISGRTGYPLGSRLNIPQSHLIKRVSVHSTRQTENLIFVLTVGNKGHLKVISIQDLYRKILDVRGGESPYLFKNSTVSVSDVVSTDHEPVVKDLNKDLIQDIILVTLSGKKHSLTAVDGGRLKKMWRIAFGSKKMLSQPVIGHFNDDEVPDIMVVLQDPMLFLLNQSLVQILDGQNGNIMWSKKLRLAKNTTPLSANIGYKSDVFLLWIEKEGKRKYQKIFPPKRAKDVEEQKTKTAQEIKRRHKAGHALNKASFDTRRGVRKSNNSAETQISKHRRSPRSVKSRQKIRSSVNDVEDELDSLVDEIFVKNFKPPSSHEKRRKPHLQPKRMENTHKILEHILKQEEEEEESSTLTGSESHSHGGTPKTITRTRFSTQEPGFYDSPRRMEERLTHRTLNNGRKQNPTTLNLPTRAITKKPRLAHILKGNRMANKEHLIAKTTKTPAKLSHRKRVEEFIINSPSSRTGDGGASNIGNRNIIKDVKERQTETTMLPTERFLDAHNKIHDATQRQSTARSGPATIDGDGNEHRQALTNILRTENKNHDTTRFKGDGGRETVIEDKNSNGRGHTLTGTFSPKLYDNRRSEPTTKMINSKKVENIVIPGNSQGNSTLHNPAVTSPTIRAALQSGNMQKIKSLPSTKTVRNGKIENVQIQTHVRDSSDIHRGIITTTKHISSKVTLPTHNIKTISENIYNDNPKSTEKNLVSDSDSVVPARVLAPHPGFTLPVAKSTKIPKPDTASAHAPVEHDIPITIEGMTDMKTDMANKLRAGKDIIVMPTKSSVTRLTTGGTLQKSTEEKREIDYKTIQTTTQRHTDIDTIKQLPLHEPTQSRQNNPAPTHDRNKQLDLGNINMIRNAITTPSTLSSEGIHKNTRGLSNTKPTPEQLGEINHTEIPAVKKPTKELNVLSSLEKSNLETKLKLRDSVFLNARTKKVKVDDDGNTGKSHISHSVKLNGTKVAQEKKQKPTQPKAQQSQPQQVVNTTKSFPSKLGNTQDPTERSHVASSKKNNHIECHKGSDLALIAIFPDSQKNTYTVISQESSVRNTKKGFSKSSSCDTQWPTFNSNPLVHDADSDGFLEIIYAVNYGEDAQIDRTMKVRKFSIKVDSDD